MAEEKSERRLRWEARRRARRRRRLVRRLLVAGAAVLAVVVVATVAVALNREPAPTGGTATDFTPAPEEPTSPFLLALGDSFLEGTGANSPESGIASQVAGGLDMKLNNLSAGGTGYLNPGPAEAEREAIVDRVDAASKYTGDVVLVATGLNDYAWIYEAKAATLADERQAVSYTLRTLVENFPDSRVVAVGPFWPNGFPVDGIVAINDVIRAEAKRAGVEFIDPIGDEWITGTRDGEAPGNAERFISDDGTHPTQAGHDYLAGRLLEELGAR